MIVIGNGQSRQKINLNNYNEEKIGCNAVIRDLHIDHLVCCDKKMVKQSLALGFNPIYTRDRWVKDFNMSEVVALPDLPYKGTKRQDDPFHWGSGPYAILLATQMSKYIKLVGFDLYGINGKLNNIYANTNGYKNIADEQVDWSYWVYQIAKIFEYNSNIQFTIYNLANWECPIDWQFKNIKVDIIENL